MPNYAAWPLIADVNAKLSALGVTLRATVDDPYRQSIIDGVAEEITRSTRRTWVAVSETRTFDGSGTGEQELNEFVSLTNVSLLYATNSTLIDLTTGVVVLKEANLPQTRIALSRSPLPGWTGAWSDQFPQGRGNISVTASWGYGATIPVNLWTAARDEMAVRLAEEALFVPGQNSAGIATGRLTQWKNDTVSQTYEMVDLDGMRVTKRYADAVKFYTRPLGSRLRRFRAPMI
jgi:hypothetical protein